MRLLKLRRSLLKKVFIFLLTPFLVFSFLPFFSPSEMSAVEPIGNLVMTPSTMVKGATATYALTYTNPVTVDAPGGFLMVSVFCQNCGPGNNSLVNLTSATLGAGSNIAGTIQRQEGMEPNSTGISLTAAVGAGQPVTLILNGVQNPNGSGTFRAFLGNNFQGNQLSEGQSAPFYLGTVNLIGRIVDPSGNPVGQVGIDVYNEDRTISSNGGAGDDGRFVIADLPAGTYTLEIHLTPGASIYIAPDPMTVTVTAGVINNLGDISVVVPPKHVTGKVTYGDGTPVTTAQVNANRRQGNGWNSTTVGSDGTYNLGLTGGTWEVRVEPKWDNENNRQMEVDWAYTGRGNSVSFAQDTTSETQSDVNFSVVKGTATVKGTLLSPDSTPLTNAGVDVRNKEGVGVGGGVNQNGAFSIHVPAGTYFLSVWAQDQTLTTPQLDAFTIADGATKDFGSITMTQKNERIKGRVTFEDGTPVPGAYVNAWSPRGSGWGETQTNANGEYTLLVSVGEWEVHLRPAPNGNYAIPGGPPTRVTVAANGTVTGVNFQVVLADAVIRGRVVNINGTLLSSLYGWAEAGKSLGADEPPMPGLGSPVEGGVFSINVPAGSFSVGIFTEPGSDYSMAQAALVTVASGETREVEILMKQNDAYITGKIYDQDQNLIRDVEAEVNGFNSQKAMKNARVNPDDGSYTMGVVGGSDWFLGVFVDANSGYMMLPPDDNKVTVAAGQTVTKDFFLLKADATVTGQVLDPSGSPLGNVFVFLDSEAVEDGDVLGASTVRSGGVGGPGEAKTGIHTGDLTRSDGTFTLSIPAGTYGIGSGAPASLGYINPDIQTVTVAKNATAAGIVLQYKVSDAKISGTITLNGAKTSAFVWAWSEDGGHSENMSFSGDYTLNVTQGDTWHLGADYESGGSYYRSQEYILPVSSATATQDIVLTKAAFTIPSPVSSTFDASKPVTITLDNGMTIIIPSGAIASSGTITVTVTPTAQLAKQKTKRPVAFGYEIKAFNSSGSQITSNFNSDVTIIIPYTDAMLTDLGITEDQISAAYWDDSSTLWQGVTSFVVDKDNNVITITVNHFTSYALVTGASDTTPAAAPSGVTVTDPQTGGKLNLAWTNPTDADLASVKIYRSETQGSLGSLVATVTSSTVYSDTGLTNGTTYYYTLRAVDTSGNESYNTDQHSGTPTLLTQLPATGHTLAQIWWQLLLSLGVFLGALGLRVLMILKTK